MMQRKKDQNLEVKVDICPVCERKFDHLEDYPLIYIVSFEKKEIPANLIFPYYDNTIFVGPNANAGNEKPPKKVLEFFKKHEDIQEFEYENARLIESFASKGFEAITVEPSFFDIIVNKDIKQGLKYNGQPIVLPNLLLVDSVLVFLSLC